MTATLPDGRMDDVFVEMARSYQQSYPDEDFRAVLVDVDSARNEVERIANELYDALFEPDAPNRAGIYFAILKELSEITIRESRKKLPFIKRIFNGTRFNCEKAPLPNRINKCKENVSLAAMMILAKQIKAFDGITSLH
jgi:hypothetical protein